MDQAGLARALGPLARRAGCMVARAIVGMTRLVAGRQVAQTQRHAEEVRDDTEMMQPYGFASRPHPGAESIVVEVGGDASHQVVIVCDDARYRFGPLKTGEAAIYDDQGQHVYLYRDGVMIKDRHGQTLRMTAAGVTVESAVAVTLKAPRVAVIADDIRLGDGETRRVARVGDLVEVGHGSSAGRWPIVTGSDRVGVV